MARYERKGVLVALSSEIQKVDLLCTSGILLALSPKPAQVEFDLSPCYKLFIGAEFLTCALTRALGHSFGRLSSVGRTGDISARARKAFGEACLAGTCSLAWTSFRTLCASMSRAFMTAGSTRRTTHRKP